MNRLPAIRFGAILAGLAAILSAAGPAFASEAELVLPRAQEAMVNFLGVELASGTILTLGLLVCLGGMVFGLMIFAGLKDLPVHKSMEEISQLIYGTCKTYLYTQGQLILLLEVLIGATMIYYFGVLKSMSAASVALILMWSLVGIAGSFMVAWFGMRINTIANGRMAFAALRGEPMLLSEIPTRSGMSIGVLLISVELLIMLIVLKFVDPSIAGLCFLGFAIGESLAASVLRICGGIFTKIADVGSDMMKIVLKLPEDDPRNPGVIADCTGDNAGDSVGPTADGFETYGVTGVALITFICLAVNAEVQWTFLVWIFTMRIIMVPTSIAAWYLNSLISRAIWGESREKRFNFEHPLTLLVWLTSLLCVFVSFGVSYFMLSAQFGELWWKLASIISCGTIAAAVIPEFTRVFTSTQSGHCREVVNASSEGGAGLTVLSGLTAGYFSVFWVGFTIAGLMLVAYVASAATLGDYMQFPSVFAFGLVAFGMLGMGPVTIAVDSYGPVTDNAQSVFELSMIEKISGIKESVKSEFGFAPDFERGKELLEGNDGAGNTFKATAKPMLIGTAVVGATTMIFSLILLLQKHFGWTDFSSLSIMQPKVIMGLLAGGAVVHWFCGAALQAVTTGAFRAVEYIKENIKLESNEKASQKDSNEVVRICTRYAQAGMVNIFIVVFSLTLAFAFFDPVFFTAYLLSIAFFGLCLAVNMANAGGCWDNAKKVVETELHMKGTDLHASAIVGDLVGDPFKDTSSVALNPIIKFTTLFGILAVEIAINSTRAFSLGFGTLCFLVGLYFVYRSFYGMRISTLNPTDYLAGKKAAAK
ncbi:MAG: sodium-translocating pyrophosphatase [Elusimicrobia bacterium GWA2_69_24]|nr:MAG: sodium-translocating pyrophosphatase [Elusimicrobia bacterium GWA2_69_24]HBL16402.1 sodium-translocating pyrophosphatase [Elusimicrobiota bacterium]